MDLPLYEELSKQIAIATDEVFGVAYLYRDESIIIVIESCSCVSVQYGAKANVDLPLYEELSKQIAIATNEVLVSRISTVAKVS